MFSPYYKPLLAIFSRRIDALKEKLRSLPLVVREDFLAELYGSLNRVLQLGNGISDMPDFPRRSPAHPSQINVILDDLEQDCRGLSEQIGVVRDDLLSLANTTIATANAALRKARRSLYSSSPGILVQPFLNAESFEQVSAFLETTSGMAMLPIVSREKADPSAISLGVESSGYFSSGDSLQELLDSNPDTFLVWNGSVLELVVSFPAPVIVNVVTINFAGSAGLIMDRMSASSDGVSEEDVTGDFPSSMRALDGSAGKYSGEWIGILKPRFVKQMRIRFRDLVGENRIILRDLGFYRWSFRPSGRIQSRLIAVPDTRLRFQAEAVEEYLLTGVNFKWSRDGVVYTPMKPGDLIETGPAGFWYRIELDRYESNFKEKSREIVQFGVDSDGHDAKPERMSVVDLGEGIVEKTFEFSEISGTVVFRDDFIPGSLTLLSGNLPMQASNYSVAGRSISFASLQNDVTIRYQTYSTSSANFVRLAPFYTPVVYEMTWSAVGK